MLPAQQYVQAGYRFVVDVDLEKFFDRVNQDILMDRLAKRIADKAVLRLIRRYLQAGVMYDGVCTARAEGTPQGGPLSPLLANVLLLDKLRDRLCRLTRRSSGRSVEQIAEDLPAYVPGWKAYFRLAQTPTVMRDLDRWVRHRLRAVQLAHWRTGRTACAALRQLGARVDEAQRIASHLRQWWHTSRLGVNRLLDLAFFDSLGVPKFS